MPAPLFDAAVIAPTARIVKAVKARHPNVPIIACRGPPDRISRAMRRAPASMPWESIT
ncbi:MAG: hypothetical protein WDM81_18365 [Rhizomicrobium sp.]